MVNPKYIGIAACVGFIFSFFVGIFSGIGFGHIMLRALISALVFTLLGAGISFLFRQFLSDTSDPGFDLPASGGTASGSGGLVNITIDDDALADDAQEPKFTVANAQAMTGAAPVKKEPAPEPGHEPPAPHAEAVEPLSAQKNDEVASPGPAAKAEPKGPEAAVAFKPVDLAAAKSAASSVPSEAPQAPSPVTSPLHREETGGSVLDELPDLGEFASGVKKNEDEVIRDSEFATGNAEQTAPVMSGMRPDAPAPVEQNASVMAQAIQTLLAKEN